MTDLIARLSSFPVPATPPRDPPSARAEPSGTEVRDYLGFAVGEARYALPLSSVSKVIEVPPVTEVPFAPEPILGIIAVRGRAIALFDTRCLLSLPGTGKTARNRVLLVDRSGETVGLLVDRVLKVYRLRESEIEPPSAAGSDLKPYVIGIGRPRAEAAEGAEEETVAQRRPRPSDSVAPQGEAQPGDEVLILVDAAVLTRG